jgi:hypothetical protein
VHPLTGVELRALRQLRRDWPGSRHLFVNERGSPMTPAGIARMLERVAAEAGFECGCTRTCCATGVAISWPMTRATPARSKITSGI